MPVVERVRTSLVVIHSFAHTPMDAEVRCEWWPRSSLAFTTFGSWEIRSARGRGIVGTNAILVANGSTEYEYRHPDGVDDREWYVTYLREVEPAAALVLPLGPRLQALRRSLGGWR